MDFREEARNAGMIRVNSRLIRACASRRSSSAYVAALVLEFMEGTKIDRLQERILTGNVSFDALIETIIEVRADDAGRRGVRADPHPGNLLVDPQGRLVLLDWDGHSRRAKRARA